MLILLIGFSFGILSATEHRFYEQLGRQYVIMESIPDQESGGLSFVLSLALNCVGIGKSLVTLWLSLSDK